MRTTLTIDDDVLEAVQHRARHEKRTAGAVLSELARRAMTQTEEFDVESLEHRNGFPILPSGGAVVTSELINSIRDEIGE